MWIANAAAALCTCAYYYNTRVLITLSYTAGRRARVCMCEPVRECACVRAWMCECIHIVRVCTARARAYSECVSFIKFIWQPVPHTNIGISPRRHRCSCCCCRRTEREPRGGTKSLSSSERERETSIMYIIITIIRRTRTRTRRLPQLHLLVSPPPAAGAAAAAVVVAYGSSDFFFSYWRNANCWYNYYRERIIMVQVSERGEKRSRKSPSRNENGGLLNNYTHVHVILPPRMKTSTTENRVKPADGNLRSRKHANRSIGPWSWGARKQCSALERALTRLVQDLVKICGSLQTIVSVGKSLIFFCSNIPTR